MVRLAGRNIDLEFEDSGVGISEKNLASMEDKLDARIPSEYREFLMKVNGGVPDKVDFTLPNNESVWLVQLLSIDRFGFGTEGFSEDDDCSLAFHNSQFNRFIPEHYLIIGIVVRDDFLVLDLVTGEVGFVEWNAVSEFAEKPDESVIIPLADSLSKFLGSLT